ncbi:MAG TPA: phosphoribosylglycinamide formyltransferase [Bacteroidales bacterium]|nr:phosphoribosylglycinamide formyltransferase [Bacteroidales bacterium]
MKNIAIFASGSGSNAENIIKYFSNRNSAKVTLVLSNKRDAFVFERAAKLDVPAIFFDRTRFYAEGEVLALLLKNKIDFIVLAGFLLLVPGDIIEAYHGKIVNIHPALLPSYGGKGMYGEKVHEAVIRNKEPQSGITIHHVNGIYDNGDIIFQAKCQVMPDDTADSLAQRIHELEYRYFPEIIERTILSLPY